jgi:hypothetical protein
VVKGDAEVEMWSKITKIAVNTSNCFVYVLFGKIKCIVFLHHETDLKWRELE